MINLINYNELNDDNIINFFVIYPSDILYSIGWNTIF